MQPAFPKMWISLYRIRFKIVISLNKGSQQGKKSCLRLPGNGRSHLEKEYSIILQNIDDLLLLFTIYSYGSLPLTPFTAGELPNYFMMTKSVQLTLFTVHSLKRFFVYLLLLISSVVTAQPANDNCSNAAVINIPNGGFGMGKFNAAANNITQATLQAGETFAPAILVAGLNKKSMWYRFTIPTTRAIRVTLAQPGTDITAGDAGFAVYKVNACTPGVADISTKLTPIGTFGNTFHPCVDSGVYYVQV